jgi:hypothetical protein
MIHRPYPLHPNQAAMVEVFLRAFRGLTKTEQTLFLRKLLRRRADREDLVSSTQLTPRRHTPRRTLHA